MEKISDKLPKRVRTARPGFCSWRHLRLFLLSLLLFGFVWNTGIFYASQPIIDQTGDRLLVKAEAATEAIFKAEEEDRAAPVAEEMKATVEEKAATVDAKAAEERKAATDFEEIEKTKNARSNVKAEARTHTNKQKPKSLVFNSDSCGSYKFPISNSIVKATNSNGGNPFAMQAYKSNDIVSRGILRGGGWEMNKVREFNQYFINYSKKHNLPLANLTFVDIGANIGWFTLSMAALGVNVLAFEPMAQNINLILESMCAPENIKSGVSGRITLYGHGLGVKNETCVIFSHNINVGDGHVKCVQSETDLVIPHDYSIRGRIPVRRLDDVVKAQGRNIVAVKMDVEGYEGNVLEGGTTLLLEGGINAIVSEFNPAWIIGKGGDPVEFMRKMSLAGYQAKKKGGAGYMSSNEMMVMSNFGGYDVTFHRRRVDE
jgi:FkbM family methyltransferase